MEKNETIEGRIFLEWLNNLAMYQQELEHLEQLVNAAGYNEMQIDASIELDALKDLIKVQQTEVNGLTEEIIKRSAQLPPVNELNQSVIPFTQLIRNNHLRENIRKVERSVFYLKYHINKLLSIAS